jgi:hypothetical protein
MAPKEGKCPVLECTARRGRSLVDERGNHRGRSAAGSSADLDAQTVVVDDALDLGLVDGAFEHSVREDVGEVEEGSGGGW